MLWWFFAWLGAAFPSFWSFSPSPARPLFYAPSSGMHAPPTTRQGRDTNTLVPPLNSTHTIALPLHRLACRGVAIIMTLSTRPRFSSKTSPPPPCSTSRHPRPFLVTSRARHHDRPHACLLRSHGGSSSSVAFTLYAFAWCCGQAYSAASFSAYGACMHEYGISTLVLPPTSELSQARAGSRVASHTCWCPCLTMLPPCLCLWPPDSIALCGRACALRPFGQCDACTTYQHMRASAREFLAGC